MSRTAEISLKVELDADNLPISIEWQATEAKSDVPVPCQSMMLSLWDGENKSMAAIDLWTRETTVDDVNMHFYQIFHKMADTYLRATKNSQVAKLIHDFGDGFGETLGIR